MKLAKTCQCSGFTVPGFTDDAAWALDCGLALRLSQLAEVECMGMQVCRLHLKQLMVLFVANGRCLLLRKLVSLVS